MRILVSGGAGYIGSHAVLALVSNGHEVIVFDSFEYGHPEAINAIKVFTNGKIAVVKGDLRNKEEVKGVFDKYPGIELVMHFGAYIQVGESVMDPIKYYMNNVGGSINLFEAMLENEVKKIVFSSTAAVYGLPGVDLINEQTPQKTVNPYGESKKIVERILDDLFVSNGLESVRLRYFNVAGASSKGIIGEDHSPESHLIPNVLFAALGKNKNVTVFGTDYATPDGTCIRDYVHVEDLVNAHIFAMEYLIKNPGVHDAFNVGSKNGYSVKEIIDACKRVTGVDFPVVFGERRAGDPDKLVADSTKLKSELGWSMKHDISSMILSAWKWHTTHPDGYLTQS